MKRYIFAICVLLVAASCADNKIKNTSVSEDDGRLRLSSSIETRVVGNQWETADAISVTMYQNGTTTPIGTPASKYLAEEAGAKVDFNAASEDQILYFPESGLVDIVAYYPYKQGAGDVLELDLSTDDEIPSEDLLWVKTQGKSESANTLDLSFRHVLPKISVTLTPGISVSVEDLLGAKVYVGDLLTKGDFNITNGQLNVDTDIPASVISLERSSDLNSVTFEALVLPQTLKTPSFIITTQEGDTFTVNSTETFELEAPRNLNFTIEVSDLNLYFTATIVGWRVDNESNLELNDLLYLNEIDANNIPEGDVWTIYDATLSGAEPFLGLLAALDAVQDTRQIELVFPSLNELPNYAFYGKDSPVSEIRPITSITAPRVVKVGDYAFQSCTALEYMSIGTYYDADNQGEDGIASISSNWLGDVDNEQTIALAKRINLNLGRAASDLIFTKDSQTNTLTFSNGDKQIFGSLR